MKRPGEIPAFDVPFRHCRNGAAGSSPALTLPGTDAQCDSAAAPKFPTTTDKRNRRHKQKLLITLILLPQQQMAKGQLPTADGPARMTP